MIVFAGKVKSTPLLKRHPETFTFVVPRLCSSMYSSSTFSDAGWYMISLMTTWARAENPPQTRAITETIRKFHLAIILPDFGDALTDESMGSCEKTKGQAARGICVSGQAPGR